MATQVYSTEEITLADGTDVLLKPLVINRLRRFQKAWSAVGELGPEDDGFDIYINCCGIALEETFKKLGKFDSLKATVDEQKDGEHLCPEYKEYLGDTLELDTIYKILDVCGGIRLNDPKLLEAIQEVEAETKAQDGKN